MKMELHHGIKVEADGIVVVIIIIIIIIRIQLNLWPTRRRGTDDDDDADYCDSNKLRCPYLHCCFEQSLFYSFKLDHKPFRIGLSRLPFFFSSSSTGMRARWHPSLLLDGS